MGERLHNGIIGTHGPGVNWDAVFGAGFESAPKDWTTVYREVTVEEMVRIAKQGLRPHPPELWLPEIHEEMRLLDGYRPREILSKGISRASAIYAAPVPDMAASNRRGDHVIIEMKVDPAECYVGDVDLVTCLIPFMGVHRYGLQRHPDSFKKYWDGLISLDDFLDHYDRIEAVEGYRWVARSDSSRKLPKSFYVPEVLVMTPVVSQRHIRIHRRPKGAEDDAE